MAKQDLVPIGRCRKLHGLKGNCIFELYNRDTVSFETTSLKIGQKVWLFPLESPQSSSSEGNAYFLKSLTFGQKILGSFKGIDDATAAEKIIPFEMRVDRRDIPALPATGDKFYLMDLMNLGVFEHVTGRKIGQIKSFYDNGAQVVLVIECSDSKGPQELELPFLKSFFPLIDLEQGRVEIILPEYL